MTKEKSNWISSELVFFSSTCALVIVFATCCVCVCVFHSPNEKKVWCCGCVYYILQSCLIIFYDIRFNTLLNKTCVCAFSLALFLHFACKVMRERKRLSARQRILIQHAIKVIVLSEACAWDPRTKISFNHATVSRPRALFQDHLTNKDAILRGVSELCDLLAQLPPFTLTQ